MTVAGLYGFTKRRLHALSIFRMYFGEGIRAFHVVDIAKQLRIGGAVVEPSPIEVQDGEQVFAVLDDQAEEIVTGRFRRILCKGAQLLLPP
jgi:hypothetical protein